MKNKIKPFSTIIYGFKKLDKHLCSNFANYLFYAYDIFSDTIFISFAEENGKMEHISFFSYINENFKKCKRLNIKPRFYTSNKKLPNIETKLNSLSEICNTTNIKKKELNNILESITHLFRKRLIPEINALLSIKENTTIEVLAKIYLYLINYNFFLKKIRLKNQTSITVLIKSKKNNENNYTDISNLSPILIRIDKKFSTENLTSNTHSNHIFNIRKKAIEILELEKVRRITTYHSNNNDEKNIKELLNIFDKQLLIHGNIKNKTKFITNKLKFLNKLGLWREAIQIYKDIFANFKRKNFGSEIDRINYLILYSTLLMSKGDELEAIKQLKLSIIYSNKNNYFHGKLEAYIQLAHANFSIKKNSTAREYMNKINKISKNITIDDKYFLLKLYNLDSVQYFEEKRYSKAVDSSILYLELAKKINNTDKIYHGYCNLSMHYNRAGKSKKAIEFAIKQVELAKRENSEVKLMKSYGNLGNIYNLKKELKKARFYYNKELYLAEKIESSFRVIQALVGIIDCYLQEERFSTIEDYCLKLFELTKNYADKELLGLAYFLLGQVYIVKRVNKKKRIVAFEYLRKAREIFLELKLSDRLSTLDKLLEQKKILL